MSNKQVFKLSIVFCGVLGALFSVTAPAVGAEVAASAIGISIIFAAIVFLGIFWALAE
jgi:hypothetical protein